MKAPGKQILEVVDIQAIEPNLVFLALLPRAMAEKTQTIAFGGEEDHIFVLTTNNFPTLYHQTIDKLQALGYTCSPYFTDTAGMQLALARYDRLEKQEKDQVEQYQYAHHVGGEEAIALIKKAYKQKDALNEGAFIDEILRLSYQAGASDVHFQAEEMGIFMRLRKDGVLHTIIMFTHQEFQKYLMKLKYIAGTKMNIIDINQDGRFDFVAERDGQKNKIDVRVSVMPGLRGESMVLRFLDPNKGIMSLEDLGVQAHNVAIIKEKLSRTVGLILVTGPTGSGKTTSVYSMLNMINAPDKKIITLEDPVEYELPGIEQSQINEKKGYTFEEGLKGILRHDPDIIMVGEIRSYESAQMAINAALTWHLVISTLHTNSAAEAIPRLINMGVKPFMLAAALSLVIAQRLVRKVAHAEQKPAPRSVDAAIKSVLQRIHKAHPHMELPYEGTIPVPVQGEKIGDDGYAGRVAVMETLNIDETIKHAIMENMPTDQLLELALKQGYLTMEDDAYLKLIAGVTSMEEIKRVL